jgi:Ca2+-binding RTX toxin-like protein
MTKTSSSSKLDGLVEGTSGNDLIDYNYTGDPDGDRVDHNDAKLSGEYGNDDRILAGAGNDTIYAGEGNDEVYGEAGNDLIDGGAGNDYLSGGAGDDTFIGGDGCDTFEGGSGLDIIDYSNSTSGISVNLATGATKGGDAGNDVIKSGIDGIIGTNYNDTLVGFDQEGTSGSDIYTNVLSGGAGNDSILGKGGDDSLYGGADNDTIDGGDGNDLIYGDSDAPESSTYVAKDLTLDWGDLAQGGACNNNTISSGTTVDMGGVAVKFGFTVQDSGATATYTTDTEYTKSGETFDSKSGLALYGKGGEGGVDNTSTTTLTFDSTDAEYGDEVQNVSFRINDIDVGPTKDYHQDIVTIRAYDADGNEVPVVYTTSGGQIISGNTITGTDLDSGGTLTEASAAGSVLVSIAGPVSKIVIDYDNGGVSDQRITVTDFNLTTTDADADHEAGDDVLSGGDGDDTIYGEAGNDYITGGEGNDVLNGGDDRDTIIGGEGDIVDGGEGGDDYDTLDLTGQGAYRVIDQTPDENGNGTNGTVEFLNTKGEVTGSLVFSNIENIVGDDINLDPTAGNDAATTDEDKPVTINVLANDTDPNGDTLSVTEATAEHGTVTINADGTLTYTPDADYNGSDTITYKVDDGNGGTDEATVAVTVKPVNDDPDAVDDADSTDYNTAVTVNVLANDTDVDGDTLTVSDATSDDGDVVINADSTITFTPATGFTGDATVSYSIEDGNGGTDTAFVTITVGAPQLDGIVEGTTGDDLIDINYTGDPEGDMIDNNDEIIAGEGPNDDIVLAGAGNDTVYAGVGNDLVYGEDGDDVLYGEDGDDSLSGGEGDDTLYGGAGNDTLDAGQGHDVLYGGDGDDYVMGGPQADTMDGGNGDDTLIGGSGADSIIGGDGSDYVTGDDGNDYIDTSGSGARPDLAFPGLWTADTDPNNDKDTVYGGAGNDTIITGDDADYIEGGAGNDVIDSGIDRDTVYGGEGNDNIIAGEGDDFVDGGDGDDTIYGGAGPGLPDAINLPDAIDPVKNNGDDTIHGGNGNDLIYGEDDNDLLYGDAGNDTIDGGVDDDTIYGGSGNDSLMGGQGDDVIYGGDGSGSSATYGELLINGALESGQKNGTFSQRASIEGWQSTSGVIETWGTGFQGEYSKDGGSFVEIDAAKGIDNIYQDVTTVEGETYTLSFDAMQRIEGSTDQIEVYYDGKLIATVTPGDEWETFTFEVTGGGDDRLMLQEVSAQNNTYGPLIDNVSLYGEIVSSEADNDTLIGGDGNDALYGEDGDDKLYGDAGNDTLSGGRGNDTLDGGAGNDQLNGGKGSDSIFGGTGNDTISVGGPDEGGGDVIDGGEDDDDNDIDVLDLSALKDFGLSVNYTSADKEDGTATWTDSHGDTQTLTFSNIEKVIPCFTPGAMVATPKGEKRVEDLAVGDKVITRDNGIQEIRWAGRCDLTRGDLLKSAHLKPVLIKAGSLGNGVPERDMLVSPNHRMLVANDKTSLYFEEHEVLVAAKHLVGNSGIQVAETLGTSYLHIMFDRHEVILADGTWTESFQPGDLTLGGMGNAQRAEIFELFPELTTQQGLEDFQAARKTLKRHEAAILRG